MRIGFTHTSSYMGQRHVRHSAGEEMAALPLSQEFTDGLVAVYARYFSDDDLKALAQFYETPAGQHFNERAAEVAADSMRFGQQIASQNMNRILRKSAATIPNSRDKPNFA